MSNNTQATSSKSKMFVKYSAIGALLAVAPVMLATEILLPMLSVQ